jgi:hypothetical protein
MADGSLEEKRSTVERTALMGIIETLVSGIEEAGVRGCEEFCSLLACSSAHLSSQIF